MGCCVYSAQYEIQPEKIAIYSKSLKKSYKVTSLDSSQSLRRNQLILENVKQANFQITKEDRQMLSKIIQQHFVFYRLPKIDKLQVIQYFVQYQAGAGTKIFNKGDQGQLFFVIKSGKVQISKYSQHQKNKKSLKVLQKGDYFGDLALLYTASRSANANCLSKCQFLCLSSEVFRKSVQQTIKRNFQIAKGFIQKTSIFSCLDKKQKIGVSFNTLFLKYETNEVIFNEGDDANCFYIVVSGTVKIFIPEKAPLLMRYGECFGQNSFKQNQVRVGTAIAQEHTCLLSISRQSLKKCLGNYLQQISYLNILKWSFNRNELFKLFTNTQKQSIMKEIQIIEYKNQEVICMQGENAQYIIIVLEEKVNSEEVGVIFNLNYLMAQNQNDMKISQRLVKNGKGHVARLRFSAIYNILGKDVQTLIKRVQNNHIKIEVPEYLNNLCLKDFKILQVISKSEYWDIYKVMDDAQRIYALKVIQKQKIMKQRLQSLLISYKDILKSLSSSFTVKLLRTFKDYQHLYFLTNYIQGVSLVELYKQAKPFESNKVKFFIACLILAVQSFHAKYIIHRNLTLQNIMIDDQGYLNIVDFGIAKHLTEVNGFRTFTITGNPHYMAPQTMQAQGYSFPADYWSLGIIMYQMIFGHLPFGDRTNDPFQIFKQIDTKRLQFSKKDCGDDAKQVLSKLLQKDQYERGKGQFLKIKQMKYFQSIDWQCLQKRKLKAPIKIKYSHYPNIINQNLLMYLKKKVKKANKKFLTSTSIWDQQF